MQNAKIVWISCIFYLFFILNLSADEAKIIKAVKIEKNEAPKIDGKLDEEVWKKAGIADDFLQFEPTLGGKPKEPTKAYILYDKEKLYIGFECFKNDPKRISGSQTRRDSEFFDDDFVEVFIDTYHDRRNCYSFAINCIGTQSDRRIANEGSLDGGGPMNNRSRAWDCAWEGRVSKNADSWIAEMAIPFSELRFNKKGDGTMGINFWRGNQEFKERDTWADVGDRQLCVSKFGCLEGLVLVDVETSQALELKPYGIIKPQIEPERKIEPDAGIDIRYPSSTITADFTINPDYGQIEADPVRINLGDVEDRLPEKRPFFQEGMELFQTPLELFYTRRVGIKDLAFGAKAVGKIKGANFALLDCQSDDTYECPEGDIFCEENRLDETKNNYLVFRTQTDIGSKSSIGFLGVNKQKADGYNRAGAIDCNITLPRNMRIIGQFTRSWFPDKVSNASIISLKRSSRGLWFEVLGADIGRDFNVESGFIERTDRKGGKASIGYEYRRDAKIFRMYHFSSNYERLYNHDDIKTNEFRRIELMINLWNFFVSLEPEWYQHTDDFDTNIVYTNRTMFCFFGFFPPKWVSLMMPMMIGKQENKMTKFIGPNLTIKPLQPLTINLGLDRVDREGDRLILNRRTGATYQFSRQMSIKGNFEITRDEQRYIFFVYAWEFVPESNFYLVYSDDKDHDKINRSIILKISYLLKWNIF
jgi:hypothetical protein